MAQAQTETKKTDEKQQEFLIQKLYVKDLSFESPLTPDVFKDEWKPHVNVDLNVNSNRLEKEQDIHQVVLSITVTVTNNEKTAYLVEVKYAGIFTLKNFTDEQAHHLLGSYCPSLILPYAREAISNVIERGGFPAVYLAPINFEALYENSLKQQKAKAEEAKKAADAKASDGDSATKH